MSERFARTELLYGSDAMKRLSDARVIIFGVGGVGGYVVEALARSGIGHLDLVDDDRVCMSNLNRQIIATEKTLGMHKVDAAAQRIADINPDCEVRCFKTFFLPETKDLFDFTQYDYVVDAIDTVTGKIELVMSAKEAGVPIICSMGAGNKTNPAAFRVADISKTAVCPLARIMRKELKKRGVDHLKVVYSEEIPITPEASAEDATRTAEVNGTITSVQRRSTPGSTAFVPSVVGLIIAGEVVNDITGYVADSD